MKENNVANNTPKRILAIDYLKALSIIFIILSHINNYNESFKLWSISFAPIVFFFSRGMVFKQKISRFSDWKNFILDRFFSILVPYFIWALIYAKLELSNVMKIAYCSHESLSLSGSLTSLWFLPCMFMGDMIFEIVFCFSEKAGSRNKGLVLISVTSLILLTSCMIIPHPSKGWPFEIDVAVQAAAWNGFGYIAMYFLKDKICSESSPKNNVLILTAIAVAGLGLSLTAYMNTEMAGGYVMVAEARYGFYPVYLLTAFGGTAFLTAMSFILAKIRISFFVKLMQMIGMNTMIIFAVHKFVIFTLQNMMKDMAIPSLAAIIIVLISVLTVSLIISPVINTYLPLLAGKMKYIGFGGKL